MPLTFHRPVITAPLFIAAAAFFMTDFDVFSDYVILLWGIGMAGLITGMALVQRRRLINNT